MTGKNLTKKKKQGTKEGINFRNELHAIYLRKYRIKRKEKECRRRGSRPNLRSNSGKIACLRRQKVGNKLLKNSRGEKETDNVKLCRCRKLIAAKRKKKKKKYRIHTREIPKIFMKPDVLQRFTFDRSSIRNIRRVQKQGMLSQIELRKPILFFFHFVTEIRFRYVFDYYEKRKKNRGIEKVRENFEFLLI